MLNGLNCSQDDLIIVGSRCGGFDFYASRKNQDDLFYLGPRDNSDLDLFCIDIPKLNFVCDCRPFKNFKSNVYCGVEFPYLKNGNLYIPDDKSYLCWAIKKKLHLSPAQRRQMQGQVFKIFDKDKNFAFDLEFVPLGHFI